MHSDPQNLKQKTWSFIYIASTLLLIQPHSPRQRTQVSLQAAIIARK